MTYQPYGQAMMPAPLQAARPSYKAFGITYMSVRGSMLVIFILIIALAGAWVASLTSGPGPGGSAAPNPNAASEMGAVFALVIGFFLLWLGYVIAAGIMAIKGVIAGVYMGLVDAGLTLVLALFGFAQGEPGAGMCWFVPSAAIITLGILALKKRYGPPAPAYGQPIQQYTGQPQAQYGGQGYAPAPYPQAPQQGYAPQPVQRAPVASPMAGGGTSAVVPSPKMAALGILALAASVDADLTHEALARARVVAAKLLGPAAQARIQRQLAGPTRVMDVDTDLVQHTMVLNEQSNDAMKANVIKAAEYVLRGPQGVVGLGEQFMATLKHQLGV